MGIKDPALAKIDALGKVSDGLKAQKAGYEEEIQKAVAELKRLQQLQVEVKALLERLAGAHAAVEQSLKNLASAHSDPEFSGELQ